MSQRTTAFSLDTEDTDCDALRAWFKLTLSYTWCLGNKASEHEPASTSHPEDIRCVGVMLMTTAGRLAGHDDHDKARLVEYFNTKLDKDKLFYSRAVDACFEKEAIDHETALAERDEARAGDRS